MNLKYLRKLYPILNKVGKETNIRVDEGNFIIDTFFRSLRDSLNDPRMPKVIIPLLGVFRPSKKKIYISIKRSLMWFKRGGSTREYITAKIRRLWKIRSRIDKEFRGDETWKEWSKKNKKKELEDLYEAEKKEKEKSREVVYGPDSNKREPTKILSDVQRGLYKRSGG